MSMNRLIDVESLAAGYNGTPVLRDVTFHVASGEVVALLGSNGAGKTTTLMVLSGLIPVLGGRVQVIGHPTSTRNPHRMARRGLAHVREGRGVFQQLTVAENLTLSARGRRNIDMAIEYFPALAGLIRRRAGLLSGGEQQMLALARALLTKPKVLMVDELSLGLAPIIVQEILPRLRRIATEQGIGMLLVEQHIHQALAIADRAYVLAQGRIVLSGDAMTLRSQPDVLKASYLGTTESGLELTNHASLRNESA